MVDPVKAFSVASTEFEQWLVRAKSRMNDHATYMKRATEVHATVVQAFTEAMTRHETMKVAAEEMKKHKGLSADKALEHLKAVDAVLSLAKQGGVVLTEDDILPVPPSDEVSKWAEWEATEQAGFYVTCYSCGDEFNAVDGGWFDDENYPFCGLDCMHEHHGGDYYPSVPRASGGAYYPEVMQVAWPQGVKPEGNSHRILRIDLDTLASRQNVVPDSEGWIAYSQSVGLFLPERTVHTDHILLMRCSQCNTHFDITEVGWKHHGYTRYYCSTGCAKAHYGANVKVAVPDMKASFKVNTDMWSSQYAKEMGTQSWRDYVAANGYILPEAVRA